MTAALGVIRVREIIRATAAVSGLAPEQLVGAQRARSVAWPRQRAVFVAHRLRPEISLPGLGRRFGHRDHTTMIHSIRRVRERLGADTTGEQRAVDAILRQLGLPPTLDLMSDADVAAHAGRVMNFEILAARRMALRHELAKVETGLVDLLQSEIAEVDRQLSLLDGRPCQGADR